MKNKKNGFSLIETAIVLGVVGLIIAGIWVAAAAVFTNQKYKALLDGTTYIVSQTQALLPSSAYDRGPLSGGYLYIQDSAHDKGISMGLFPADWISGSIIKSPFGGQVVLYAVNSSSFMIDFKGIPRDICIKLVGAIALHPSHTEGYISPSEQKWTKSITGYPIDWRQSGCTTNSNLVGFGFEYLLH